jgi:two-component system, chemotaxis family, CheB/CheR fusion protein
MVRKSATRKSASAGRIKLVSSAQNDTKDSRKKTPAGDAPGSSKPARGEAIIPVVGIGASASGVEALQRFFGQLPAACKLSFVVVQHRLPRQKIALDRLLEPVTDLPIVRVTKNLVIEPGHIYLSPPGKFVSIADDRLRLSSPRAASCRMSLPIDHFFRSLAAARHDQAVGIVLSGPTCDGTQGVEAIKAAGGFTFAQPPTSDTLAVMPDSAMASRMIDFILPADEIADKLLSVLDHPYARAGDDAEPIVDERGPGLKRIFTLLHRKTGKDISDYKTMFVRLRIARRMAVHQVHQWSDYINILARDPAEPDRLLKDIFIGATGFFRDLEAFETLRDKVLIPLVLSRQSGGGIRMWVAGCAGGEEAYSLAILLAEAMERLNTRLAVRIFASDIDADAIQVARSGIYMQNIAADVSSKRLSRYFNHANAAYKIKKRIRDTIVFSVHDLVTDPPFSTIDLISCRNLLKYVNPELQEKILTLFYYALNPGGHLFLGPTESIGEFGDCFSRVSRKHRIFRQCDVPPAHRHRRIRPPAFTGYAANPSADEGRIAPSLSNLCSYAGRLILDEYAPPAVLVDRDFNILHFFGDTDPYLKTPTGTVSFNILKIAREGLVSALAQCLPLALTSGRERAMEDICVSSPQGLIQTRIAVRPLSEKVTGRQLLIVLFGHRPEVDPKDRRPSADAERRPAVRKLVDELQVTREYLQTTISMLETANEECRATNEELRAANEELEISREELESTNEELLSVNHEHHQKIEALTQANNDINNLLESTAVACLFLDLNLRVRRFTPAVARLINLRRSDIGRPIGDITTRMQGVDINACARRVVESLESQQLEVRDKIGRWYEMRLFPYRTSDNIIEGVTITFADNTEWRQAHLLRQITDVFAKTTDAVVIQDFDGGILAWNKAAETLYGWTENEALHLHITEITAEEDRHDYAAVAGRLRQGGTASPFEVTRISKSGLPMTVQLQVTTLLDEAQRPARFASFERPITRPVARKCREEGSP